MCAVGRILKSRERAAAQGKRAVAHFDHAVGTALKRSLFNNKRTLVHFDCRTAVPDKVSAEEHYVIFFYALEVALYGIVALVGAALNGHASRGSDDDRGARGARVFPFAKNFAAAYAILEDHLRRACNGEEADFIGGKALPVDIHGKASLLDRIRLPDALDRMQELYLVGIAALRRLERTPKRALTDERTLLSPLCFDINRCYVCVFFIEKILLIQQQLRAFAHKKLKSDRIWMLGKIQRAADDRMSVDGIRRTERAARELRRGCGIDAESTCRVDKITVMNFENTRGIDRIRGGIEGAAVHNECALGFHRNGRAVAFGIIFIYTCINLQRTRIHVQSIAESRSDRARAVRIGIRDHESRLLSIHLDGKCRPGIVFDSDGGVLKGISVQIQREALLHHDHFRNIDMVGKLHVFARLDRVAKRLLIRGLDHRVRIIHHRGGNEREAKHKAGRQNRDQ